MKITLENHMNFPAGTEVEFDFGAYYPIVSGVVTGYTVQHATKHFPAFVLLDAVYTDAETDELVETTISEFTEKGIGVRLIRVAEMPTKSNNSPWSVAS